MSADPNSRSSCRSLVSLGLRSHPSSQSSISDADKGAGLQHKTYCVNMLYVTITYTHDVNMHVHTCILGLKQIS